MSPNKLISFLTIWVDLNLERKLNFKPRCRDEDEGMAKAECVKKPTDTVYKEVCVRSVHLKHYKMILTKHSLGK